MWYGVIGTNCDGDPVAWWCERECDAEACLAMVRHFGGRADGWRCRRAS